MWLRHAPAPLLWIHPIAKKYVLMPNGDSNVLFCSIGIASVGTCPPLAMNFKTHFFDSLKCPRLPAGAFSLFCHIILGRRRSSWRVRMTASTIFTASPGRNGSTHHTMALARLAPVMTMNQMVPST